MHPSRSLVVCILLGAVFVQPSRFLLLCILRDALLCDVLGVFAPEVCRVVLSWGSWRKTSPPSLRFFLPKDLFGCNLFLSGATLVRVVLEKMSPPLPNGSLLEGYRCWWQFGRERFPSFCWPSRGSMFTGEATCANFVFWKKRLPPWMLSRWVVFFFVFASVGSNDGCRGFG